MHHIIYMSRSVKPLSDAELRLLLEQARNANEEQNITGALVYGDGQFMQVIEGQESTLATLYAKLLDDPRHINIVKLADKQITQRSFSNWSMGFHAVSPQEFASLAGYVHPSQMELTVAGLSEADSLLLHMMKAFITQQPG